MPIRIALSTTVLPEYKLHLYERLARHPGWELVAWHGPGRADWALPDADPGDRFPHRSARNLHFELRLPWLGRRAAPTGRVVGLPIVWQRVWRELWSFRPDVLVLDEFVKVASSWPLLLEARRRGVPAILYGHGENRERHTMHGTLQAAAIERARRAMHGLASAVVVYSDPSAQALRAREPDTPCFVSPNTLDTEAIAAELARLPEGHAARVRLALGVPAGALLVATAGRLIRQHDPRPLMEAVREARRQGAVVYLLIIGSGPLEAEVEAARARMLPSDRAAIVRAPRQPLGETTRLLAAADVAVSPGTIGLNVVHAFAVGLPFVAARNFDHGPEEAYLRHEDNGLWIEDVGPSLARALVRLARDPALRLRLGEAAARYAREHLTPEAQARGFEAAIEHVLAQRDRDRRVARAAAGGA